MPHAKGRSHSIPYKSSLFVLKPTHLSNGYTSVSLAEVEDTWDPVQVLSVAPVLGLFYRGQQDCQHACEYD